MASKSPHKCQTSVFVIADHRGKSAGERVEKSSEQYRHQRTTSWHYLMGFGHFFLPGLGRVGVGLPPTDMASLSFTSHVSTSGPLRKRTVLSRSTSTALIQRRTSAPSSPVILDRSSWILNDRRWRWSWKEVVMARAEPEGRDSSSFSQQPDSENQLQELTPSETCDPLSSLDGKSTPDLEAAYQPKTNLLKVLSIIAVALMGTAAINHCWVAANQDLAMALLFGIGYVGIIFEESLAFNKSGVGLLMAVSLWVIRSTGAPSTEIAVSEIEHASAEVSGIVFFLLGAMTIVEVVDSHQDFKLITDKITTRNPRTLLWVVGFVTFFLSSILDNLTSTIIMVSLLRKLVPPSEYRKLLGAVVVISANAGGAWTPIGDVTTTMLWIDGQISTLQTIKDLFIPSAISLAVPLALMSLTREVDGKGEDSPTILSSQKMAP
ncbi:hypothetical protein Nepgr_004690 [Nepenthes gracilis]|uniref:Citrate transporter-like domain-containing protein n=1 Tax=Nepenthes gracilis TaxID=150966 RepID=A0AAD3XFN6_NEPGR|nr:hypothetical protein Nepgr_004690 [Nepenthes gracilis]